MAKNIFATITHVAEKIAEAITGHNGDTDAHPTLTNQINVLSNERGYENIKFFEGAVDWNNVTESGYYFANGWDSSHSNLPPDDLGTMVVTKARDTDVEQMFKCANSIWYRAKREDGFWTQWEQLATTDKTFLLGSRVMTLSQITKAGSYTVSSTDGTFPAQYGDCYRSNGDEYSLIFTSSTGLMFINKFRIGTGLLGWKSIATTTKTDIPFPFNTGYKQANDLGYTCKIVKNSLNEGTIYIAVAKTDGTDFAINTSHPIGNLPLGFRSKFNTVNSSSAGDLLVYYPNNNASLIIYNDVLFCSCSVACKAIYGQIKYEVV